jgi:hypothetical protein
VTVDDVRILRDIGMYPLSRVLKRLLILYLEQFYSTQIVSFIIASHAFTLLTKVQDEMPVNAAELI